MLHFSLGLQPPLYGPAFSTPASKGWFAPGVRHSMRQTPPSPPFKFKQRRPSAQSLPNLHGAPSGRLFELMQPAVPTLSSTRQTLLTAHGSCLNGLQRSRYEQTLWISFSPTKSERSHEPAMPSGSLLPHAWSSPS